MGSASHLTGLRNFKPTTRTGLCPAFAVKFVDCPVSWRALGILQSCRPKRNCESRRREALRQKGSVPVSLSWLILALAALGLLTAEACASPPSAEFPLPRARPALKSDQPLKSAAHSAPLKGAAEPTLRAVPSRPLAALEASRPTPLHAMSVAPRAARAVAPLAMAATANTSPLDLAAVKQVIDLAHKGRPDEATNIAGTISDPLARKLAEWVILRSDNTNPSFTRYAAFVTANPGWPHAAFGTGARSADRSVREMPGG